MRTKSNFCQVSHTSRNLCNPLTFSLEGSNVSVSCKGVRLASIPARTLRCRRGQEVARLAALFQTHSQVEQEAKRAAQSAARQGFSFRNVYQGAVNSGFRNRNIPDAAVQFMDGAITMALQLENAKL